jgi:hypothetical protein
LQRPGIAGLTQPSANQHDRGSSAAFFSGFLMGSLTLCLIGLIATVGPTAALFLVQLTLPVAMIAIVLVVSLSSTARPVWGRLFLINANYQHRTCCG